jgi:hypothetical protein
VRAFAKGGAAQTWILLPGQGGRVKKVGGAALLFLEIAASIWAMDFAFSFMNEPSDIFFWGGLGLLFLVGAFWYYRIQVFRHRKDKERGGENEEGVATKITRLEHTIGDDLRGRMRDAHWPWKRGN